MLCKENAKNKPADTAGNAKVSQCQSGLRNNIKALENNTQYRVETDFCISMDLLLENVDAFTRNTINRLANNATFAHMTPSIAVLKR